MKCPYCGRKMTLDGYQKLYTWFAQYTCYWTTCKIDRPTKNYPIDFVPTQEQIDAAKARLAEIRNGSLRDFETD